MVGHRPSSHIEWKVPSDIAVSLSVIGCTFLSRLVKSAGAGRGLQPRWATVHGLSSVRFRSQSPFKKNILTLQVPYAIKQLHIDHTSRRRESRANRERNRRCNPGTCNMRCQTHCQIKPLAHSWAGKVGKGGRARRPAWKFSHCLRR